MKIGYLMQAGVPDIRQHPLSGPASHVKHIFDELHNFGHQVLILASIDGQIWKSADCQDFKPVVIHWLDKGPLRFFERIIRRIQSKLQLPYAAFFESTRFAAACRQELGDCDLFYERMGWVGYGGGLAACWLGRPLVLEVNGDHLSELKALGIEPHGVQRWLSNWLMKDSVNMSVQVIATGEGWRDAFIQRWNVDPEKVNVIENGTQVVDLLSREQLRSFSMRDPETEPVTIAYVGGFEPWHGLSILLPAAARVIQSGADIQLVLIGSGSTQGKIHSQARDLCIENEVKFTGHLHIFEMAELLSKVDIGISPYCGRVEYSGLKLLDYKGAGLCIIASGEGDQPHVITHGKTGWVVPPCDEEALCEAIDYLAHNPDLRTAMGRQAREEAEKYHRWQHTAQKLEAIFLQLTDQ